MAFRKLGSLSLGVIILAALSCPAWADPPVGAFGPSWYEGVWRVTIQEICFRSSDGQLVRLPKETLYLSLGGDTKKLDGGYCGSFYLDQRLKTEAGWVCLDFDYPSEADETYLVDGAGSKSFQVNRVPGSCDFKFQGTLTTSVKNAKAGMKKANILRLRKQSKINGWNLAWCQLGRDGIPASVVTKDDGNEVFLKCQSTWTANWIGEPVLAR